MANPFLEIENPYAEVKTMHEEASKMQLEFQRLCWELFHVNPQGKRFMEILKERYLMQPLFKPTDPQCKELALFWEGFKEAIRGFNNFGLQHQQYVNGVNNSGKPKPNSRSKPKSSAK